jgi:hypothetical protein
METTILLGYPVHSLACGPIDFTNIKLETSSLSGLYLQYAYLIAIEHNSVIALDFAAGFFPFSLRTGEIGALRPYQPTVSHDEMIAVVSRKFGEFVFLPKPVRHDPAAV